jgi:hypothetical protein
MDYCYGSEGVLYKTNEHDYAIYRTKPTDHHPYPYLMMMLDCCYYFEYVKQKKNI